MIIHDGGLTLGDVDRVVLGCGGFERGRCHRPFEPESDDKKQPSQIEKLSRQAAETPRPKRPRADESFSKFFARFSARALEWGLVNANTRRGKCCADWALARGKNTVGP
jgi:hypothetical protein